VTGRAADRRCRRAGRARRQWRDAIWARFRWQVLRGRRTIPAIL